VRSLVEQYIEANANWDPVRLGRLRHQDWYADWPQSGERVPNHQADVQIHSSHPDYPHHVLRRAIAAEEHHITGSPLFNLTRVSELGPLLVLELRLTYRLDGAWDSVTLAEVRDQKIWKETTFHCRLMEPPIWRSRWVRLESADERPLRASVVCRPVAEAAHRQAVLDHLSRPIRTFAESASLFYHDDVELIWPQSAEHVSGLDDLVSITIGHPTPPVSNLRGTWALGDLAIAEIASEYGGTTWFEVALYEFRGAKVAKATSYFAEALEPPDWRRGLTVPIP